MVLEDAGFSCRTLPEPDHTEALKLLCLAKYGLSIAFAHYQQNVCHNVGLDPEVALAWDRDYNVGVGQGLARPLIEPQGHAIRGGIIPAVRMLSQPYPHTLLTGVLQYAPTA